MKLSLQFFYTKISYKHPGTSISLSGDQMPTFSSLGIITDDMTVSDEVVYIDLIPGVATEFPSHTSVITTKARKKHFKGCNVIALADETDLTEIIQLVSNTFTHYFGWADSIYEAIAKNMDLQTIIDLTAPLLGNPLYIADSSFKMLAGWGGDFGEVNPTWRYQERYRYLPYSVMQDLIETGELSTLFNSSQALLVENSAGFTALPFISKAIRKEGIHYGNFYIIGFYSPLNQCDLELADYLGKVLSTALYGNLNYLETSTLYHAHFLEDVIEGTLTDKQIMIDQLKALHWGLEGDYMLALYSTVQDNDAIRQHMMALLTSDIEAQCFEHEGNIVVILNDCSQRMDKIKKRLRHLAHDFNRTVAISEQFVDFPLINKYYDQVRFTLEATEGKDVKERMFSYDDLFLDHLIEIVGETIPGYGPAVKLKRHDDEHGTEFCHTLLTWLMQDRNSVHASGELFVHRNTLKNRLERIRGIVDVDLDDFKTRERMLLSLYSIDKLE